MAMPVTTQFPTPFESSNNPVLRKQVVLRLIGREISYADFFHLTHCLLRAEGKHFSIERRKQYIIESVENQLIPDLNFNSEEVRVSKLLKFLLGSIEYGHCLVTQTLVSSTFFKNSLSHHIFGIFCKAIQKSNPKITKILLNEMKKNDINRAFVLVCSKGYHDIAERMKNHEFLSTEQLDKGFSFACHNNHLNVVRVLKTHSKLTLLHKEISLALFRKNTDLIKELTDEEKNDSDYIARQFILACHRNDSSIARLFLHYQKLSINNLRIGLRSFYGDKKINNLRYELRFNRRCALITLEVFYALPIYGLMGAGVFCLYWISVKFRSYHDFLPFKGYAKH